MVAANGQRTATLLTSLRVVAVIPPIYQPRLTSGTGRCYTRASVLERDEPLTQAGAALITRLIWLAGVTEIRVSDNTSIGGHRAVEFVFTLDLAEAAVHNSARDIYTALATAATAGAGT